MRRLLNITLFYHALFTAILLVVCSIFFYWMSQSLYTHQIDETLNHKLNNFIQKTQPILHENDLIFFNKINPDQQILQQPQIRQSIFKEIDIIDSSEMEPEPYRILYHPIQIDTHPYTLMLRISLLEKEDTIRGIAGIFTAFIVVLFIGLYVINRTISKKVWQPFYRTITFLNKFDIQELESKPLPAATIKEFDQLNHTINKLISKSVTTYRLEKEFTENAAHELQTPIAILQFKLDLLLQNPSLTDKQSEIIQTLYETVARISRINKNLLLLSKIDADVFRETEKINLSHFIDNIWHNFSDQAKSMAINFSKKDGVYLILDINKNMLEMLLNNLFSNAILHNYQQGEIVLKIERNFMTVANTSATKTLPHEKLFKRFSDINESSKGNGLGLAIIATICKKNNWRIKYFYENEMHHFSIHF